MPRLGFLPINDSLFRPGGVIGRRGYLLNFVSCVLIFGAALFYTAVLDRFGILNPRAQGSVARLFFEVALALPVPIALVASVYAMTINLLKRINDLRGRSGAPILWIALLLLPVVGVLANAVLFFREGMVSGRARG